MSRYLSALRAEPKDVKIGDVVVATKVYGYESGKDVAGGFKTRPDVLNSAHELEQRGRILRQREDWKKRLDPKLAHEPSEVFVAPIAAGEKVVASRKAATAKMVKDHYLSSARWHTRPTEWQSQSNLCRNERRTPEKDKQEGSGEHRPISPHPFFLMTYHLSLLLHDTWAVDRSIRPLLD
jgi:hypothetical protein